MRRLSHVSVSVRGVSAWRSHSRASACPGATSPRKAKRAVALETAGPNHGPALLKLPPQALAKTFAAPFRGGGWARPPGSRPGACPHPHPRAGVPSLPSLERLPPTSARGVARLHRSQNSHFPDASLFLFSVVPTSQWHPEGVRPAAQPRAGRHRGVHERWAWPRGAGAPCRARPAPDPPSGPPTADTELVNHMAGVPRLLPPLVDAPLLAEGPAPCPRKSPDPMQQHRALAGVCPPPNTKCRSACLRSRRAAVLPLGDGLSFSGDRVTGPPLCGESAVVAAQPVPQASCLALSFSAPLWGHPRGDPGPASVVRRCLSL